MFPFALPRFTPTAVPQVLAFFPVSFVPLLPASDFLPLNPFRSIGFSSSSYSAFSLFLSASSLVCLAPAPSVLPRSFRHSGFHRFHRLVSDPISLCFRLLGSLPRFLSSFPTSLPQPFRWCLPIFHSLSVISNSGICPSLPHSFVRFRFRL